MIIAHSYVALVVAAVDGVSWKNQATPGERSQSEPLEPEYDQEAAIQRALKDAPDITQDDIEWMNKLFAGN